MFLVYFLSVGVVGNTTVDIIEDLVNNLSNITNKFLKDIFDDLEYRLVNKLLQNDKESLSNYIVEKYA